VRLSTLLLALLLATPAPARAEENPWVPFADGPDLVILHTNDTHAHLEPYDRKELRSVGGIARRATMIRQARKQFGDKLLVVDAGDTFQGTPVFNFFRGKADYEAMDAAGYEATTVGNHDLDEGLDNLKTQIKSRSMRLISSNLVDATTRKPVFGADWVVERGGNRIGIFGVIGEVSAWQSIARKHRKGLDVLPAAETARRKAQELRAKGCKTILMLSHSGFEEDQALAAAVPGIDLIIGGHSHTRVDHPKEVRCGTWTTLVAQAFQWGEYLGRIELDLAPDGHIQAHNGFLVPVAGDTPEAEDVATLVKGYTSRIEIAMGEVVGQAPQGLSTDGKYDRECGLGRWASDIVRQTTGAEIAFLNAGGLRASINPGPVHVGDIYQVFPFENTLVTLSMTGSQLRRLLGLVARREAGLLYMSGATALLGDGKVEEVLVGGKPLQDGRVYRVATIDYLAQANDKYTTFSEATQFKDQGILLRDAIIDWVRKHPKASEPQGIRLQVRSWPAKS